MKLIVGLMSSVAFSLLAPAASAGVIGFASLANLRFSLIDLDPNDGKVPALTLVPDPRPSAVGTYVSRQGEYLPSRSPFQPLSTAFDDGQRSAAASTHAGGAYAFMKSSVTLDTPSAAASTTVTASNSGPAYGWALTPNTGLLIEADLHAVIAVTELNFRGDWADASVSIYLTQPAATGRSNTLDAAEMSLSLSWDPSDPNSTVFRKESFESAAVSWTNNTSETALIGFSYTVSVQGESMVTGQPAIPEPAPWLLLSTGLLLAMLRKIPANFGATALGRGNAGEWASREGLGVLEGGDIEADGLAGSVRC